MSQGLNSTRKGLDETEKLAISGSPEVVEAVPNQVDVDYQNLSLQAIDRILSPDFDFKPDLLARANTAYRANAAINSTDWRKTDLMAPPEYYELVEILNEVIQSGRLPMGFPYEGDLWDQLVHNPNYIFARLARLQFVTVLPTVYNAINALPSLEHSDSITVVILGVGNGDEIGDILDNFSVKGDFNKAHGKKVNFLVIDQNIEALADLKSRFATEYPAGPENSSIRYGDDFSIFTVQEDFTTAKLDSMFGEGSKLPEHLKSDVPRWLVIKGITSGNMEVEKLSEVGNNFLREGDLYYLDAAVAPKSLSPEYVSQVIENYDSVEFRNLASHRFYRLLGLCGVDQSEISSCFGADGRDKNLEAVHSVENGAVSVKLVYSMPETWTKRFKKSAYVKHTVGETLKIVCYQSDRRITDVITRSLSTDFETLQTSSLVVPQMLWYLGEKKI